MSRDLVLKHNAIKSEACEEHGNETNWFLVKSLSVKSSWKKPVKVMDLFWKRCGDAHVANKPQVLCFLITPA